MIERRTFIAGSLATALCGTAHSAAAAAAEGGSLFGMIGKMKAAAGQRDALIALLEGRSAASDENSEKCENKKQERSSGKE